MPDRITSLVRRERICPCCGEPTPSPSMPACWSHWKLLPEDLQIELITTHSRCELLKYADALSRSIKVWKELKAWKGYVRQPK
jgi:hypothetical protein